MKIQDIEHRIQKTDTCWLWTGDMSGTQYGRIKLKNGKSKAAHRIVYELLVGKIPEGLELDHLCRVRPCVNPNHLEPVTTAENVFRAKAFEPKKTHCPRGHEYSKENTYVDVYITKNGDTRKCRECRKCKAKGMRDYRKRIKEGKLHPLHTN